jgi:hypothetical protein
MNAIQLRQQWQMTTPSDEQGVQIFHARSLNVIENDAFSGENAEKQGQVA